MDASAAVALMSVGAFDGIKDPVTAEEYMHLGSWEHLMLTLKWSQQEHTYGKEHYVLNQLKKFHKDLTKSVYRVHCPDGQMIDCKDKNEIEQRLNMPRAIINYIIRTQNKPPKTPKYAGCNQYKIKETKFVLKGNDYIEVAN